MKTRLFNAVSHSIVKLRFQQLPKLKFRLLLKILAASFLRFSVAGKQKRNSDFYGMAEKAGVKKTVRLCGLLHCT